MPKVQEFACRDGDCSVDMFSVHYESGTPDEEYETAYPCPGCGEKDSLDELGQ